jgi:3-dehydroquinate dehydratase
VVTGQYEGDETKRREAFRLAMQLRANYIDVELEISILSNKLRFLAQKVSIGKYHLILLFENPECKEPSQPKNLSC